jgi:hypothetical protein
MAPSSPAPAPLGAVAHPPDVPAPPRRGFPRPASPARRPAPVPVRPRRSFPSPPDLAPGPDAAGARPLGLTRLCSRRVCPGWPRRGPPRPAVVAPVRGRVPPACPARGRGGPVRHDRGYGAVGPRHSPTARAACSTPVHPPLPSHGALARRVRGSAPACVRLVRSASARPCARVLEWCAQCFGAAHRALGATRSVLSRVTCPSTPSHPSNPHVFYAR